MFLLQYLYIPTLEETYHDKVLPSFFVSPSFFFSESKFSSLSFVCISYLFVCVCVCEFDVDGRSKRCTMEYWSLIENFERLKIAAIKRLMMFLFLFLCLHSSWKIIKSRSSYNYSDQTAVEKYLRTAAERLERCGRQQEALATRTCAWWPWGSKHHCEPWAEHRWAPQRPIEGHQQSVECSEQE